jgi:hypothetical protein
MPKKFCRLWLELTAVRVERVQEISAGEMFLEGIKLQSFPAMRGDFESLWASIYGEKSWERNPWVWVLTFKKVNP